MLGNFGGNTKSPMGKSFGAGNDFNHFNPNQGRFAGDQFRADDRPRSQNMGPNSR